MRKPRRISTRLSGADRRELILASARSLFARHGYAATSVDDIAAAAGVTKPVVYDHFPSKSALYVALMKDLRDELLAEASANLSGPVASPDRLRRAIGDFYARVHRDPALVELLFVQPRHQPELLREWQRLEREVIAGLKPLIASIAPRLKPWQLDVAAHLLHHGLNATTQAWPREATAADMTELLTRLFWGGLEAYA